MNPRKRLLLALPLFWLSSTHTEPNLYPTDDGSEDERIFYELLQQFCKPSGTKFKTSSVAQKPTQYDDITTTPAATPVSPELTSEQAQKELRKTSDHYDTYREELKRDEQPFYENFLQQDLDTAQNKLNSQQALIQMLKEEKDKEKKLRYVDIAGTAMCAGFYWITNEYMSIAFGTFACILALDAARRTLDIQTLTTMENRWENDIVTQKLQLEELKKAQAATQNQRS